jgi:hypothetical protein
MRRVVYVQEFLVAALLTACGGGSQDPVPTVPVAAATPTPAPTSPRVASSTPLR